MRSSPIFVNVANDCRLATSYLLRRLIERIIATRKLNANFGMVRVGVRLGLKSTNLNWAVLLTIYKSGVTVL
jgi:hypothetical protein